MILLGGAVLLGLLTGLAAWALAGGGGVQARALDATESALSRLRPAAVRTAAAPSASAADLMRSPLFALTTGPGAVREPAIRVDGLSVTPRRTAALLSIDGKPADWLELGRSRDGVTLQEVTASGVTVETLVGVKQLALGDQSAASAPLPGATPATVAPRAAQDLPPPSVRGPPEPASAPRP